MENSGKNPATVIILVLIIVVTVFAGWWAYGTLGRQYVYQEDSTATKYPGLGVFSEEVEERIWVTPKGLGRPFFDSLQNLDSYSTELYEIVPVPAQSQIRYVVGFFERWETVEESTDKYLVLKYQKDGPEQKFRINTETLFWVENVSMKLKKDKPNNILAQGKINYNKIKKGDAVIIIPVFDPPELNKTDELGNYLAGSVILRRVTKKI